MYIVLTEIDAKTKILCTIKSMSTGPSLPDVKGFKLGWSDSSTWPVELAQDGRYLRAPKYYGTCDDDANTNIAGVLEVITEKDYFERRAAEYEARKPYSSWIWDDSSHEWVAPIPRPADAILNGGNVRYRWDEETTNWVPMEE